MIVEDAAAGIEAGKRAGMKTLIVGSANGDDFYYKSLNEIKITDII